MKIIEIALDNGADDSAGLYSSLIQKNDKLIQFFVENGSFDIKYGLECSLETRNKKWIDYFLSLGLHHYKKNSRMWRAALQSGDEKLIEYFMPQNPDYTDIHCVTYGGNLKWILEFINRGNDPMIVFCNINNVEILPTLERITGFTPDWNKVLRDAAMCGRTELCKYAIERGATDYTKAVKLASGNQCWDVIEYIVSLNEKMDLEYIMENMLSDACYQQTDYHDSVKYDYYLEYFKNMYNEYKYY